MRAVFIAAFAATALVPVVPPMQARAVNCDFDLACARVTVMLGGSGTGTFKTYSDSARTLPEGIDCLLQGQIATGKCSADFSVAIGGVTRTIYWQAAAAADSWADYDCGNPPCHSNYASGSVTVAAGNSKSINQTFTLKDPRTLTVWKLGTGTGLVTSSPRGINCGSACVVSYAVLSSVTLTATADPGMVFAGWMGGGCSGTGTCTTAMVSNVTVNASFVLAASPTPTLIITSTPAASPSPAVTPTKSPTPTKTPVASSPAPTQQVSHPATPPGSVTPSTNGAQPSASVTDEVPSSFGETSRESSGAPSQAATPDVATAGGDGPLLIVIGLPLVALGMAFAGYRLGRRARVS